MPSYMKLFNKVKNEHPEFMPNILLLDGNGILHHRGCGIASHIGLVMNMPCISVSKTLICMDGMYEKEIKNIMKGVVCTREQ